MIQTHFLRTPYSGMHLRAYGGNPVENDFRPFVFLVLHHEGKNIVETKRMIYMRQIVRFFVFSLKNKNYEVWGRGQSPAEKRLLFREYS